MHKERQDRARKNTTDDLKHAKIEMHVRVNECAKMHACMSFLCCVFACACLRLFAAVYAS